MFKLDHAPILCGAHLTPEAAALLPDIERAINDCFVSAGHTPVQCGRVVALRHTDTRGLSSAFSAALYLGKYADATNRHRLFTMIDAGHSYEPLRGESVSFLFVGVGKPTYDHLVTYTLRNRRVCGGMRGNAPWGFVVPEEARNPAQYIEDMRHALDRYSLRVASGESPQAARSALPAGIVLPPFQLDFSEEALAKNIFKQRLWQAGAQGETKAIVRDMYECCLRLDSIKWAKLTEAITQPMKHHRMMRQAKKIDRPTYDRLCADFDRPEKSMWG